MVLDKLTRSS